MLIDYQTVNLYFQNIKGIQANHRFRLYSLLDIAQILIYISESIKFITW